MEDIEPVYESNITGALRNYYLFGIDPGSFTKAMILDDFETAFSTAHIHIKEEETIRGLMAGMRIMLPPQCLGENYVKWKEQGGLRGVTPEELLAIRITGNWIRS